MMINDDAGIPGLSAFTAGADDEDGNEVPKAFITRKC